MKKKRLSLIFLLVAFSAFLFSCTIEDLEQVLNSQLNSNTTTATTNESNNYDEISLNGDLLTIKYIDVGQGDSIFIILPNEKTLLIDAGVPGSFDVISDVIDSEGYSNIDVILATHPHADHIGAMSDVVRNYDVGSIYMPKVSSTTKTFETLLQTISNKGLKINNAKAGSYIELDDSVLIEIIAPNSTGYEDTNDYSIVIKLTYNNTAFLFTGDAETVSEKEILNGGYDLSADVLKVAHHGSLTSTSASFLKAVEPTYAIISVGVDNSYGHPKQKLLDRLADFGVTVYRTDEVGTITVTSDGDDIMISATN